MPDFVSGSFGSLVYVEEFERIEIVFRHARECSIGVVRGVGIALQPFAETAITHDGDTQLQVLVNEIG